MEYTYTLKGEPEALVFKRYDDAPGWSNHKESRLLTTITLESQHNDRPIIYGPIKLHATFYFHTPSSARSHTRANDGDWYTKRPSIFFLLNFLEHSAMGIIFADTAQIVDMTCSKVFEKEARTVFTITELHEKKDSKKEKCTCGYGCRKDG